MKMNEIETKDLMEALNIGKALVSLYKNSRRKVSVRHALIINKKWGISLHDIRPDIYPKEVFKKDK